nr:pyrimidine 5'-nucleotidase [Enterovirga sp.]
MTDAAPPHSSVPPARHFDRVDTRVFDLANTLYPHEAQVWPQIDLRITVYIMDLFGLDGLSARALQKFFYHQHGTTLRALMDQYGVDPTDYMDFCHDIDHSAIELNPLLGAAIERLPGRKLILTNGSARHAQSIAMKLGIFDHFEDVFDIAAADYVPKPDRRTYERFLDRHGVDPTRAALFEDISANLLVPHQLGMTTCLVVPKTPDPFRDAIEQAVIVAPHVDHVTSDLAGFLEQCLRAASEGAEPAPRAATR